MRPSRARNRALPRTDGEQRRRRSARREVRAEVHGSRCADRVLREAGDRRRDRQVLRGRRGPSRRASSGVAANVNGTAMPAQAAPSVTSAVSLALAERHGGGERLHAVAEDIDVPGAHADPPAQRPSPRRARSSRARRRARNRAKPALGIDAVRRSMSPSTIEAVTGARDAAGNRQRLAREAKHGVPHAHAARRRPRARCARSGAARRKPPAARHRHPASLPVARERTGPRRSTRGLEIAAQDAGGSGRRHEDPPDRAPRHEAVERNAGALRLPVERRDGRRCPDPSASGGESATLPGLQHEVDLRARAGRKRGGGSDFEPPRRRRGPSHAGALERDRRLQARAAERAPPRLRPTRGCADRSWPARWRHRTPGAGDAYARSDPDNVPRASCIATRTPSNIEVRVLRPGWCRRRS